MDFHKTCNDGTQIGEDRLQFQGIGSKLTVLQTRDKTRRPPGPKADPWIGNTLQLARDPLRFLEDVAAEFGDVAYLRIRGMDAYFLSNPSHIDDLLVGHHDDLTLDRLSRGLSDALGDSLLVGYGGDWKDRRNLMRPAFQGEFLTQYAATLVEITRKETHKWRSGQILDIHDEMRRLALKIAAGTLFGYDLSPAYERVAEYLDTTMSAVLGILKTGIRLPWFIPTPGNIASLKAMAGLRSIIDEIVADHRCRDNGQSDDLVFDMLSQHGSGKLGFSNKQLRDELLTILLVGHETSGLALTYVCWLLGQHPEVLSIVTEELDNTIGDRPASIKDIDDLAYTSWVVSEALRLLPPVWAIGREALVGIWIGGYFLPAGAQIFVSPWVNHRDPSLFESPKAFRPSRWAGGLARRLPRFGYYPFGGGQRLCLGHRFALIELVMALATILQRFAIKPVPGATLVLRPTITLRPRHPLRVQVVCRQ